MYCLKCGRDTVAEKVFCEACLETMAKHPVKPGTAIQLHPRNTKVAPKKPVKRPLSPEEQIASLKRSRFILSVSVAILSLCLLAVIFYMHTSSEEIPPVTEETTQETTQETTEETTEETTQATTEATEPSTEAATTETGNVSRETSGR